MAHPAQPVRGAGDAGIHCNLNKCNRPAGKAREMLDESSAGGAAEHPPASVTAQEQ